MARRNATTSRSSSLTGKSDDRPDNLLKKTVKRRRMCVIPSYKSPLTHFRKSNLRSRAKHISEDLDDSIVLVEEVTGLPDSIDFTLSTGPKKCTATADESVIILSDNEENLLEKETDVQLLNSQTVVEDDLSGENSKLALGGKVRRKIQPRVKPKTITSKVLPETKSSMQGLCPESNTAEPQSISIDSEDENTSPNDDASRSHPQAEIIIIDNSLIGRSNDVSVSTVSSSLSPGESSRTATTQDDISVLCKPRKELQTAAEQFASLSLGKRNEKCGTCPVFCIDTTGDPSLAFSVLKGPSAKRRKVNNKKSVRNTNWATFENNKSARRLPIDKLNVADDGQARIDESENCRRAETTTQKPTIEIRVDRIGSCRERDTGTTNETAERLHPHKMNAGSGHSEANVIGSSRKTAVTDESSETLPPKKVKSRKIKTRDNAMGSYYSAQTIVNTPGSLREIIIDGCNIATQYTKGQYFSEEGLKLVIDYFKLRGHTVKAFVPQHVRSMKNVVLEKLYTDGVVVFTPSRRIGGKRISSYDDRYILDYAAMSDGIVVSQDQYRDLYTEKLEWRRVIEKRLLVPTFVGKCVMFPEDPLGRHGPTLDVFLKH